MESGALFQEVGAGRTAAKSPELGIPEGVREVIGRRLGRLSEGTNRILGLAAVIGRQFDLALLAKIAEVSEDAVLDALDEATAAALVTEVRGGAEQFTFRHALIRTTLYEELSATRRARLHQRVGTPNSLAALMVPIRSLVALAKPRTCALDAFACIMKDEKSEAFSG